MMRPYLHSFLSRAYALGFDIIIWSATSMRWIETKMSSTGVLSHRDYRIAYLVDGAAMITVEHPRRGRVDAKPLGVLFSLPEFAGRVHPARTIMFDDLRRNFVCNPFNGLRIRACRNLPSIRDSDTELAALSVYLELLLQEQAEDIRDRHKHRGWRKLVEEKLAAGWRPREMLLPVLAVGQASASTAAGAGGGSGSSSGGTGGASGGTGGAAGGAGGV